SSTPAHVSNRPVLVAIGHVACHHRRTQPLGERRCNDQKALSQGSSSAPIAAEHTAIHACTSLGRGYGSTPCPFPRPAGRSGMAFRSKLGQAESGVRRTSDQSAVTVGYLPGPTAQHAL